MTPALDREVLRSYIEDVAGRAHRLLADMHDATAIAVVHDGCPYTMVDLVIGQERHMAYHVGSISTILQRYTGNPLPWIGYPR